MARSPLMQPNNLEELFQATQRIALQLHNRLDRLTHGHELMTDALQKDTNEKLHSINVNCDRLEILVQREPPQSRQRQHLRMTQLVHDVRLLQNAYENYTRQLDQKRREQEERENLLLNTTFKPNTETSILMDQAMSENVKLGTANRGLDDLLGAGTNILQDLQLQRGTLKRAQRRVLDIANTLGMSGAVMRLIERRQDQDKYILFGGMALTVFIMWAAVHYLT